MENPIKMDDLEVFTPIFGNTHMVPGWFFHLETDIQLKGEESGEMKVGDGHQ